MYNLNIGYSRKLSNLAKTYTKNAKYSGRNNHFTFKLAIFYDICIRADIPPETKIKTFLTILKNLILDYYYYNIITNAVTLDFD